MTYLCMPRWESFVLAGKLLSQIKKPEGGGEEGGRVDGGGRIAIISFREMVLLFLFTVQKHANIKDSINTWMDEKTHETGRKHYILNLPVLLTGVWSGPMREQKCGTD